MFFNQKHLEVLAKHSLQGPVLRVTQEVALLTSPPMVLQLLVLAHALSISLLFLDTLSISSADLQEPLFPLRGEFFLRHLKRGQLSKNKGPARVEEGALLLEETSGWGDECCHR